MSLLFEGLEGGPFLENTWIVGDPESGDAVLVDPGSFDAADLDALVGRLEHHGLTPRAIVNTHGHIDHIAGVHALQERFGLPFYIHPGEKMWLSSLPQQCAMFGVPPIPTPKVDHWISDGDLLEFGTLKIEVRHLPGHTKGGCALLLDGHVLVGDTLFAGSVGRTDFPDGDADTLARSIREGLYSLDDETIVHSGHGPDTTIGRERQTNPFVRG
ncbi:MAG: MBL fold metallo-hydrolase [Deltaproteobacteria bacterium]|nr:MBL fold metallo-hydrolase [Deltaproteobacteria bacterium]